MSNLNLVQSLVADLTKRKAYGSLELEFREGVITFVRRKETFITAPSEKELDGPVAPRGAHGPNDRITTAV